MAVQASWTSGTLPTVVGSGVTLDTAGIPPIGPDAIKFTQVASTACAVRLAYGASGNTAALRAYVLTPAAWASAANVVLSVTDAALTTQAARMSFAGTGNPGSVRLINSAGTTLAASANGVIANSTIYRFELACDATADVSRVRVFPLASDTAIYDTGDIANVVSVTLGLAIVGNFSTTPTVGVYEAARIVGTDVYGVVGRDATDNPRVTRPRPLVNRVAIMRANF